MFALPYLKILIYYACYLNLIELNERHFKEKQYFCPKFCKHLTNNLLIKSGKND